MTTAHEKKRQGMIVNLPHKTGRTLAQWIAIARRAPVENDAELARWLKSEHGLGHFQARLVVSEARAARCGESR